MNSVFGFLVKFLTVVLLFHAGTGNNVLAQIPEIKFDQITTENVIRVKGLSQNSIYCLLRDSKGFMWIGTWDGLNKYDGYSFTLYNTENGLSNATINALMQDEEGNIWIGTDYGLNVLQRESGGIVQYFHQENNPNSLSSNHITLLFQDDSNIIWIGTDFGLNRFNKNSGTFTSFNFFDQRSDSSRSNYISSTIMDGSGQLWIGTRFGLHCYDPDANQFKQYRLGEDVAPPDTYGKYQINDIVIDPEGNLCIATRDGLYILNPFTGRSKEMKNPKQGPAVLSGNDISALHFDGRGQLWVGTSEGLDLFGPGYYYLRSFKAGIGTLSLTNNDVKCIYQDPSSAIWIGTYKGLNKVDLSPSRFTHFSNETENPNSLSDNIVYDILEDRRGSVWIATFGGVNIFDRKKQQFSFLKNDPRNPHSLSGNKVRTLSLDSAGNIWAGTETNGVNWIDPLTRDIRHYTHNPGDTNSLTENYILSMMTDSRGRIWIGTGRGLNILDPETGRNTRLTRNSGPGIRLVDNIVWSIYEDRQGDFWVGTTEALHRISKDFSQVERFVHDPGNPNTISANRIFSVYEDRAGIFWIGTAGGGLNRYDPVRKEFKIYTEKSGLPNNFVYSTLEDDAGNLWLTTNWGISKFNKQSEVFVNYDTRDGVQGNEFNIGAAFRNNKGEMYFGGMNGFNVFHPDDITLNRVPPAIVLTRFEVLSELFRNDLDDGEVIRLNYAENFFAIEFSALDFTNPSKNLYRYKLDNYDDEWILANATQRRAEYRKVPPGTYRFKVIGSNNDGVWNTEGTSITIIISPPWWKSWIFRFAIFLMAIVLVWGGIYLRINNIRKKHEVEKKMLNIEKQIFELEQKALRLQMNPHFIFNSLNAIQNFVLSNDTDKAVNYLAKFSHLMRMILANSTASHIPLKDELKALTYYMDLERLRFDNKFKYEIQVDPSIDEEFIEIPPMLFQPYVENAIIHGLVNSPREGKLDIKLQLSDKGILHCVIEDNGIGREKAMEIRASSGIKRQPKGMVITQERLQILNKQSSRNSIVRVTDLIDQRGEALGTRIELEIQFKDI